MSEVVPPASFFPYLTLQHLREHLLHIHERMPLLTFQDALCVVICQQTARTRNARAKPSRPLRVHDSPEALGDVIAMFVAEVPDLMAGAGLVTVPAASPDAANREAHERFLIWQNTILLPSQALAAELCNATDDLPATERWERRERTWHSSRAVQLGIVHPILVATAVGMRFEDITRSIESVIRDLTGNDDVRNDVAAVSNAVLEAALCKAPIGLTFRGKDGGQHINEQALREVVAKALGMRRKEVAQPEAETGTTKPKRRVRRWTRHRTFDEVPAQLQAGNSDPFRVAADVEIARRIREARDALAREDRSVQAALDYLEHRDEASRKTVAARWRLTIKQLRRGEQRVRTVFLLNGLDRAI